MNTVSRPAFLVLLILAANHSAAQDVACSSCHTEQTAGETHKAANLSCQSCHGGDMMHAASPTTGVLRFDDEPAAERSAACAACHNDAHGDRKNAFLKAGQGCNDCHSVHQDASSSHNTARCTALSKLVRYFEYSPEKVDALAELDACSAPSARASRETTSNDRTFLAALRFVDAHRP